MFIQLPDEVIVVIEFATAGYGCLCAESLRPVADSLSDNRISVVATGCVLCADSIRHIASWLQY